MDLEQLYPADQVKIDDGVWIPISDKVSFLLSYYQSSHAQLTFHSECQKLGAAGISPEKAVVVAMRSTLVKCVILGWKGLTEGGKLIEYSIETAERILDQYPGLDVDIMNKALDLQYFRKEAIKETMEK